MVSYNRMRAQEIKNKQLLLLIDGPSEGQIDPSSWLKGKGYTTWRATDFSHAMEELSDFTVRVRPDVVVLEASPISQCLKTLRESLCLSDGQSDLSVVGISRKVGSDPQETFLAHDLDQLEMLISREAKASPC